MITIETSVGTFTARDETLAQGILDAYAPDAWSTLTDDEYDACMAAVDAWSI